MAAGPAATPPTDVAVVDDSTSLLHRGTLSALHDPKITFTFSGDRSTTVGRKTKSGQGMATVDVALTTKGYVSRVHAWIRHTTVGGWSISDNKSTNGTAVNGTKIAPSTAVPLAHGDTITFGVATRKDGSAAACDDTLVFRFEHSTVNARPTPAECTRGSDKKSMSERAEQTIDELLRATECSICCENHMRPVELSGCAHTFCKTCIHEHLVKVGKFCPECRETVKVRPAENRIVRELVDTIVKGLSDEERTEREALVAKRRVEEERVSFDFLPSPDAASDTRSRKRIRLSQCPGNVSLPEGFASLFGRNAGAGLAGSTFASSPSRGGTAEDPLVQND
eukprot:CAMPEP_0206289678 /NCGR_PEP_ID=MMETSP0106_2-20121207/2237_1 /ASSEMBLY_ACC=CAM_ASM_000206 /TAXON_ID=81532 /ORGANISM="Acanthoeca-like sp., Strain 10tr" /LENGTH=337 /DNA_ID=CAMNT_0053720233 /DNA_START=236 /DNA_END=1247 /DNA_ORIENTATION=+